MERKTDTPGCWRWAALLLMLFGLFQINVGLTTLRTPPAAANLLPVPPAALAAVALLWAVAALVLGGMAWRGQRGAWRGIAWYMLVFGVYSLARGAILTAADYERARLPFLVAASLFTMFIALVVLVWGYTKGYKQNGD